MPTPPLLQRLRERKLVQWALAYLAGAWVIYEVTATVGASWGISDTILRGLFVVLAVRFFITLVFAWYHGEKGRQRASGPDHQPLVRGPRCGRVMRLVVDPTCPIWH